MSALPEQICTDSAASMITLPSYFTFRDQTIQGLNRLDQLIQQEESKSITPNINNQLTLFIRNQREQINSLFPQDDSSPPVLVELDGALKANLKSLIAKLEVKSVETLKNAIQSQDKLLQKLSNIIKKIQEEDPKMCSKLDFMAESECMFEELTKFNDGINKGLQQFQTRENFIMHLSQNLSRQDGALYQNQTVLQDFLNQVATKISNGGPELVRLFQLEVFNDFGEKPYEIEGNTEGEFRIIENETFLYYGEVRRDNPTKIIGKGIKVIKENGALFQGWHLDDVNVSGKGRWISSRLKKIYVGDFKNSMCQGYGELRKVIGDLQKTIYKGPWEFDRYEGFGTYYYDDGRICEGIFVSNRMQGEGKTTYPDGRFQVGMFVDDKYDGEVILTKPDGTRYRQHFVQGTQQGQNELIE